MTADTPTLSPSASAPIVRLAPPFVTVSKYRPFVGEAVALHCAPADPRATVRWVGRVESDSLDIQYSPRDSGRIGFTCTTTLGSEQATAPIDILVERDRGAPNTPPPELNDALRCEPLQDGVYECVARFRYTSRANTWGLAPDCFWNAGHGLWVTSRDKDGASPVLQVCRARVSVPVSDVEGGERSMPVEVAAADAFGREVRSSATIRVTTAPCKLLSGVGDVSPLRRDVEGERWDPAGTNRALEKQGLIERVLEGPPGLQGAASALMRRLGSCLSANPGNLDGCVLLGHVCRSAHPENGGDPEGVDCIPKACVDEYLAYRRTHCAKTDPGLFFDGHCYGKEK